MYVKQVYFVDNEQLSDINEKRLKRYLTNLLNSPNQACQTSLTHLSQCKSKKATCVVHLVTHFDQIIASPLEMEILPFESKLCSCRTTVYIKIVKNLILTPVVLPTLLA